MKGKDGNSYRSILRGMSVFGSVQVLQMLITLVRGKLVAMLLGPSGMGVSALFTSSSNTLQRFSSLGLNLAIVKETAARNDNPEALAETLSVARRLITATALAGALLCMLFSPFLSRVTFGDERMTMQFMLLGVAVGLSVAFNGKLSILQGLQEVRRISRASLVGGLSGLFIGVPLYWLFGDDGIVPAMAVYALVMYIFYSVSLSRSVRLPAVRFIWQSHKPMVRQLVVLGILLMTNDLIVSLVQYLINIYVKSQGSTDAVGLYQAANSITNQYAGIIFTVMAMDYFPRLSRCAGDNREMRDVVNRQMEITSLFIAPAASLLILTAPLVIRLLLTSEFLEVTPLMRWMGLGTLLRALMVPLGYISFAKGNRRLFFWMEGVGCNLLTLAYSCLFFRFFGLIGLGYAFVVDNLSCLVIYYIVNRRLYGYSFSREARYLSLLAIAVGSAVFATTFIPDTTVGNISGTAMALAMTAYTIVSLRKKLRGNT